MLLLHMEMTQRVEQVAHHQAFVTKTAKLTMTTEYAKNVTVASNLTRKTDVSKSFPHRHLQLKTIAANMYSLTQKENTTKKSFQVARRFASNVTKDTTWTKNQSAINFQKTVRPLTLMENVLIVLMVTRSIQKEAVN